jgi:hypothetical protein
MDKNGTTIGDDYDDYQGAGEWPRDELKRRLSEALKHGQLQSFTTTSSTKYEICN